MYLFVVADILEVDIAFLCGLIALLILASVAARKTYTIRFLFISFLKCVNCARSL